MLADMGVTKIQSSRFQVEVPGGEAGNSTSNTQAVDRLLMAYWP